MGSNCGKKTGCEKICTWYTLDGSRLSLLFRSSGCTPQLARSVILLCAITWETMVPACVVVCTWSTMVGRSWWKNIVHKRDEMSFMSDFKNQCADVYRRFFLTCGCTLRISFIRFRIDELWHHIGRVEGEAAMIFVVNMTCMLVGRGRSDTYKSLHCIV